MKLIRELSKSFNDTSLLKKKYYLITSFLGLIGGGVGILIWYNLSIFFGKLMGFDIDAPIHEEETFILFALFVVIFFTVLVFTLYVSMVVMAGSFGILMVCLGKFTRKEALDYALYSKYPKYWFDNHKDTP